MPVHAYVVTGLHLRLWLIMFVNNSVHCCCPCVCHLCQRFTCMRVWQKWCPLFVSLPLGDSHSSNGARFLCVCRNMKTTLYSDSAGADICCGHSVFVLVSIYDISVAHVLCSRGHVVWIAYVFFIVKKVNVNCVRVLCRLWDIQCIPCNASCVGGNLGGFCMLYCVGSQIR